MLSARRTRGRKGLSSPEALLKEACCKLKVRDHERLLNFVEKTQRPKGDIIRDAILIYLDSHEESAKSEAAS